MCFSLILSNILLYFVLMQCAQILLVMRPSEEAPSDFQDYTLVAIIAVATYLGQYPMGEQHGVPTLARKYGQDSSALEQVFEYIIASVNNYRETYMRMQALQEEGALEEDETIEKINDGRRRTHPTGGLMAAMSDLDGFAAKLNAILQADLTAAAMAAGPLDAGPITLAGPVDPDSAAEIESLLSKLRNIQEQVALLDRMQNIRVKNIQDEYQRFMERVRAKAQSAIDHANTTYSQQRNVLMTRFDSLVNYISKNHQPLQTHSNENQQATVTSMSVTKSQSSPPQQHDLQQNSVSVNPMNMLSHSMASQLLALQANMAAAAAAAAGGGKLGAMGAPTAQQQANLAAAFAAQQQMHVISQMSEADMKAQIEQLESLSKSGVQGLDQQVNMLQAAMQAAAQAVQPGSDAIAKASNGTAQDTPRDLGIPPRPPQYNQLPLNRLTASQSQQIIEEQAEQAQEQQQGIDGRSNDVKMENVDHQEVEAQEKNLEEENPPSAAGNEVNHAEPLREKSLFETLVEDFNPDIEIETAADVPESTPDDPPAAHSSQTGEAREETDKPAKKGDVNRVASLSGWVPPSSPSKPLPEF